MNCKRLDRSRRMNLNPKANPALSLQFLFDGGIPTQWMFRLLEFGNVPHHLSIVYSSYSKINT